MKFTYGTLCVETLYEHASNDPDALSIRGDSPEGKKFGLLVKELTKGIKVCQGLYLWGKYDDHGLWRNIYIGKSENLKTSDLQVRITDELKEERLFLWWRRIFFNTEEYLNVYKKRYPKYTHKSVVHFNRSIEKWGTTHIIWVAIENIDSTDIPKIEEDLIETLNPIANEKRPAPVNYLTAKTTEIIKTFRDEIHRNREGAYKLKAIQNIKRI